MKTNRKRLFTYRLIIMLAALGVCTGSSVATEEKGEESSILCFRPCWSPDGTKIVFDSTGPDNTSGNEDIYVINADGTGLTRLTTSPARDNDPAWAPNGSRIAFDREIDDKTEVYLINPDGTGETQFTVEDSGVDEDSTGNGIPAWSPDSTKLAFVTTRSGNGDIMMAIVATGVEIDYLDASNEEESQPAWSPDGAWIAYSKGHSRWIGQRMAVNYHIWKRSVTGGEPIQLTSGGENEEFDEFYPKWSPNGQKIAYTVRRRLAHASFMYLMDVDGTNQAEMFAGLGQAANLQNPHDPAWSPNGLKLVVVADSPNG